MPDGRPDGLKIVEAANWVGVALAFSRLDYPIVARGRPELTRPGVYVLYGGPNPSALEDSCYIGEAGIGIDRLDVQYEEKEWNYCVFFTSKDGSLHKGHAKYLEASLLGLAINNKRWHVDQGGSRLPALPEWEEGAVKDFLGDMLSIYVILGVRAFEPLDGGASEAEGGGDWYHLGGAEAMGKPVANGFLVPAGAKAKPESTPGFTGAYRRLRDKLEEDGALLLSDDRESRLLREEYLFASPSAAASVLLGHSANGRDRWKRDEKTLKTVEGDELLAAAQKLALDLDPSLLLEETSSGF